MKKIIHLLNLNQCLVPSAKHTRSNIPVWRTQIGDFTVFFSQMHQTTYKNLKALKQVHFMVTDLTNGNMKSFIVTDEAMNDIEYVLKLIVEK